MVVDNLIAYLIFSVMGGIVLYATLFILVGVFIIDKRYDKKYLRREKLLYGAIKISSIVFAILLFVVFL